MQVVVNGLAEGIGIALMAAAFQLTYLPTRLFLVSLAAIYSVAPYVALLAPGPLGLMAALFACSAISLATLRFNHAPLIARRATPGIHLIASLGLYLVVTQLLVMAFGDDPKVASFVGFGTVSTGAIALDERQATLLTAGAALLTAAVAGLKFSKVGLKLRALASNSRLFATQGHDLQTYYSIAFVASGVLCAASALLRQNQIGFDPYSGMATFLTMLAAVFIGGRESFYAPIFAALAIGLVESIAAWFVSTRWSDAIVFAVLALVLVVRPNGLLSPARRLEAAP